MKKRIAKKLRQRKRKILNRLNKRSLPEHPGPMLNPGTIQYEMADRTRGITYGGIGAVQLLVKRLGLDKAINRRLHLFKLHNPYFESDHVLNMAYNILCNGQCLEDIERLRNDEVYLDAVGADRIPDPTTAGDFCRRFSAEQVEILQDIINAIRLKVWKQQEPSFFDEAIIDADGTIAETTGECKQGMDLSYKGIRFENNPALRISFGSVALMMLPLWSAWPATLIWFKMALYPLLDSHKFILGCFLGRAAMLAFFLLSLN